MLNNKGYLRVTIFVWEYGSRKDRFIHRLVAEYFCTNPDKINYIILIKLFLKIKKVFVILLNM